MVIPSVAHSPKVCGTVNYYGKNPDSLDSGSSIKRIYWNKQRPPVEIYPVEITGTNEFGSGSSSFDVKCQPLSEWEKMKEWTNLELEYQTARRWARI